MRPVRWVDTHERATADQETVRRERPGIDASLVEGPYSVGVDDDPCGVI